VCGDAVEWDKLGSALGMADSDKCKQELFKVGTVIQEMVVV